MEWLTSNRLCKSVIEQPQQKINKETEDLNFTNQKVLGIDRKHDLITEERETAIISLKI